MKIVEEYGEINHTLIRANTVISLALLLLGLLVLLHVMKITFIDVNFAPSGPLAFHLLLMSGLLAASKRKLKNPFLLMPTCKLWVYVFMDMGLYCISIINVVLIGVALYGMKVENIWIILLALPAYLSWQNHLQNEANNTLRNEHDLEKENEDGPSDAEVFSEVARANPLEILWSGFANIKNQLIISFLTIFFLLIGILYYYYLSAAFLDGNIWSYGTITQVIGESIHGLIPITLALIIIIPLVFGFMALWKATVRWKLKKDQDNIDRDLNNHEINLIEYCTEHLEKYVEEKTYTFLVKSIYWLVVIGFIGVLIGYIFIALIGDGLGANWFKPERVAGLEWYIYLDPIGVTEVLGVFVIIVGYFALFTHLFRNWEALSIHNVLKSKTENTGPDDKLGTLREDIALDVRKYIITNKYTFDPPSYLRNHNKSYGKWMNISTLVIFCISLYFWALDRRDYELFAPNFIEYTDYWTGEVHQDKYDDVVAIQITCKLGKKDKLDREYELLLKNGREIRLIGADGSLTKNLDNWERVDKILSGQGTPKVHGRFNQSSDKTGKAFNVKQCEAALVKRHGQPTADRIMKLMGV